MLGIAAAAIAEGAGRAARPRSVAAESDKGRLMSVYDTARDKLRAHDRQEPTDDRPLLDGTVAENHDDELTVFVEPDWMLNGTNPDEWYHTTAFIEFDSREELA